MPRSRVTIRDVAARAGVSYQTVSRVINDSPRVNPKTRQRVKTAIADLGYRPNAIARSMARGRTLNLACIAPNLSDYTFARTIEGAQAEAHEHGYYLFSASAAEVGTFKSLIGELIDSRRTEGLLVINPFQDDRHQAIPASVPVVYVAAASRSEQIHSVVLEDEQAGYAATRHLHELGHHQIALITGPEPEDCARDRTLGYQRVLSEHGLAADPGLIQTGDWSATSGYAAVSALLDQKTPFTAIFAQNDRMAVGATRALRQAGLEVPGDISVMGFDDMPLASYFHPPLTTMRHDMYQIGQIAAQTLIQVIEKQDTTQIHYRVPAELIIRDSTGRPGNTNKQEV